MPSARSDWIMLQTPRTVLIGRLCKWVNHNTADTISPVKLMTLWLAASRAHNVHCVAADDYESTVKIARATIQIDVRSAFCVGTYEENSKMPAFRLCLRDD